MSSPLVGNQFSAFFHCATNCNFRERLARRLTAMLVRKSFVSKVHSDGREMKRDLSNMMCHSEKTAFSYFLQEKSKNVAQTYSEMHSRMQLKSKSPEWIDECIFNLYQKELHSMETIMFDTVRSKADEIILCPFMEKEIRDKLQYQQKKLVEGSCEKLDNKHKTDNDPDAGDVDYITPTDELNSDDASDIGSPGCFASSCVSATGGNANQKVLL